MISEVESVDVSRPFRFDLKALLLGVTGVGVVLTPVHWFGVPYLLSVAFSSALVICCILAVRSDARGGAFFLSLFAAMIGFPFAIVFLVFFIHAFFNLIACSVLLLIGVRPRVYGFATAGVAMAVYAWFIWDGVETLRELAALKAKFPFVSIEDRLAFEKKPIRPAASRAVPPQLTPAIANKLDQIEDVLQWQHDRRVWALEALHDDTYYQFASVAGFGFSRMPMMHPRQLVLDSREPVSLPLRLAFGANAPDRQELSPIHSTAMLNFIDPDRSGLVHSHTAVAGFESHGFSKLQQSLNRDERDDRDSVHWQIERLELVSLLRHDTPRVYVATTLPQMDQLEGVPHRALNEFEAAALPKLESTQDVVIDEVPQRIQMLGAVRATTTCLECHEGQRGKLLGAFSYEIAPITDETAVTAHTASQLSSER